MSDHCSRCVFTTVCKAASTWTGKMQSTESEYGTPYLATHHVTFKGKTKMTKKSTEQGKSNEFVASKVITFANDADFPSQAPTL